MTLELIDAPSPASLPVNSSREITACSLSESTDPNLIAEWQVLFHGDRSASVWQHPRSVLTECEHLAKSRCEPVLIADRCGAELLGGAILLPKTIRTNQAGGIGPGWKLHGYRLVGGRFLQRDETPSDSERLLAAVLDAVQSRNADFLLIEDLDQTSPLWLQIGETTPRGWKLFVPNGYQARLRIQFPEHGPDYWQQFSKKTLSTFRRKLKKFGETRLERITRADQVPGFLAAAREISLQTWQTRMLGLRIRNTDAERAGMSALAEAGMLRSYLWYSDNEPAAFCVGNQTHGVFNYEEVGYATKFARFSPGQMLVVQMLEDLLACETPQWFDFGGGDAEYKRMFANRTSTSGTVWLTPPSLRARASLGWIQLCRTAKQSVRHAVTKLGLATRVRQWIRYGGAKPSADETKTNKSDEENES